MSALLDSLRGLDTPGRRIFLLCLALGLLTFASLSPVVLNGFIKFDDHQYVTENLHVTSGLNWANIKWALQTGYASNWHPLTWVSHMCDWELFGSTAGGHHLTNLLLHVANTLILFGLLWGLTSRLWPGATVAALFGVHPLHVESVAWVAERKDVLSTFFFLLTIAAYCRYAQAPTNTQPLFQSPNRQRPLTSAASFMRKRSGPYFYCLALLLFALGLMSKPMLVTLPFLLGLLDWWPLNRVERALSDKRYFGLLITEKIPFLLLTILSSVATFLAQAGSHSITTGLPLRLRVANTVVSYLKYIAKTLWPADLAIYYPHPDTRYGLPPSPGYPPSEQWPVWLVLIGLLFLAGISCLAIGFGRRRRWLVTGWFWYLGTLVPVIGLVQVGMQAMADRYTYIPSIGLFLCLVWGGLELLERRPFGARTLMTCAIFAVIACSVLTYQQCLYWRSNFSVFDHALKATRHNAVAECNVGEELALLGKLDLAKQHFLNAQLADPRYPLAYLDLGNCFELEGKLEQAIPQFETTVRLRPWSESARLRLASAAKLLNRQDQALRQYEEVLKLNPNQPGVHFEMSRLLAAQIKLAEATDHLNKALLLKPDDLAALTELGRLLAAQGKFIDAQAPLSRCVALCPTNATLHLELGKTFMLSGKTSEAAAEFSQVVRLDPDMPQRLLQEGKNLSTQGQLNAALVRFNTTLWLKPDSSPALSEVAWILATHPQPQLRNGARALLLARRALEITGGKDARAWAALDTACAESGRFEDAISAVEKARDLSLEAGDQIAAQACETRLALYHARRAFHQ